MQKEWDELAEVFNPTKFEQHYGRNVTKGEIGCTLSHLVGLSSDRRRSKCDGK